VARAGGWDGTDLRLDRQGAQSSPLSAFSDIRAMSQVAAATALYAYLRDIGQIDDPVLKLAFRYARTCLPASRRADEDRDGTSSLGERRYDL
jgi:hypothetical protein